MQNIDVKCDVFKINEHEYFNKQGLVNLIYKGYGRSFTHVKGIQIEFVNIEHDYNLIFTL